jgi:GT2 family glycosyltransferase
MTIPENSTRLLVEWERMKLAATQKLARGKELVESRVERSRSIAWRLDERREDVQDISEIQMKRRRASVVIPNWNGREFLSACLSSLRNQAYGDLEIVLVDNDSTDGSVAFARERYPEAKIIRLEKNYGFAKAMNAGIRTSEGEYVACLNNDTEASPQWLSELVACMERHPRAAAIASKMLDQRNPRLVDGAGDIMTRYLRAYPRGRGEEDAGQYDEEMEVFGASGGASLWRARVLRELGFFDEDLFAYYEDVDLSFRARLAGYECWYAPRAVMLHAGGGTSSQGADEFVHYHAIRNRWSVIVKDAPSGLLWRNAHRIVIAEVFSIVRATRERKVRLVLSAYRDVLHRLPAWRQRRRAIQAQRAVATKDLLRAMTRGYPAFWKRVHRV